MTGKAAGETFVMHRCMRLAVTVAACGDRAVPVLVACNAGNRFMFAEAFFPDSIDPGMTGTAGFRRQVLAVLNLSRHVRRMACNAGGQSLPLLMRFMAGEAGWFKAVRCVAGRAGNL